MSFTEKWMQLEMDMLSELSQQPPKDKVFTLICDSWILYRYIKSCVQGYDMKVELSRGKRN